MVTCDKLLFWIGKFTKGLVAEEGLEPPTRGLWFRCSNQLSYSASPRLWVVIKANSRIICTPPHTRSEVLLVFANAGQAVKSKQRKKITAKPAGPCPRRADPMALILWISQRHYYLSSASGQTKTPDRRKEGPLTIPLGRTTSSIILGKFAICPKILPAGQLSKFLSPISLARRPRRPAPPAFCRKNPFFWPVGLQILKHPPRLARGI